MAVALPYVRSSSSSDGPPLIAKIGTIVFWLVLFRVALEPIFLAYSTNENHCTGIFTGGSWDNSTSTPLTKWNAPDCVLHDYTRENVTDCFRDQRIVFIGDSTIRQLYWAATNRIDHYQEELALLDFYAVNDKHRNLSMVLEGVKIEYIYDPWMNSTTLKTIVGDYVGGRKPALLVLGTPGLWAARHAGDQYMDAFRFGVNNIRPVLDVSVQSYAFRRNWPSRQDFSSAKPTVIVIPPPMPFQQLLTIQRATVMRPERINAMNDLLRQLPSAEESHVMWSINEMMVTGGEAGYNFDGLHASRKVRDKAMSLVLNPRCNSGLSWDSKRSSPTCCIKYPIGRYWYNGIPAFICGMAFLGMSLKPVSTPSADKFTAIIGIGAKILAACGYAYLIDRLPILPKLPLASSNMYPILGTIVAWAALTWKESSIEAVTERGHDEPVFLSRAQTDEIKGFLQVAIVICGMGNTEALYIHKLGRLANSLYVFLSVYGHSRYFFAKKDITWSRFGNVILRLNALNTILSFAMLTTSVWYPIEITFWFTITFCTFKIHSSMNQNIFSFLFKLIFVFWTIQIILISYIFNPLLHILLSRTHLHWDIPHIQSALALNKILPFPAMLLAVLTDRISRLRSGTAKPNTGTAGSTADDLDDVLVDLIIRPSCGPSGPSVAPVITGIAVLMLMAAGYIAGSPAYTPSASEFDFWWPFLAVSVVMALVFLRNCTSGIKRRSFVGAAVVGRYALEISLLKNHVFWGENGTALVSFVGNRGFWVMRVPQTIILGIGLLYAAALCRLAVRGEY